MLTPSIAHICMLTLTHKHVYPRTAHISMLTPTQRTLVYLPYHSSHRYVYPSTVHISVLTRAQLTLSMFTLAKLTQLCVA